MNQREQIETLLIPKAYRRDASDIVEDSLNAGYDLDWIANCLVAFGVETLILNSWLRKTFSIERGPV